MDVSGGGVGLKESGRLRHFRAPRTLADDAATRASRGLTPLAILGGALAAGPAIAPESIVRIAAAWILCVPLAGTRVKRADPAERLFMIASAVVIAWFLGGGVIWLAVALWALNLAPPAAGRFRALDGWRSPLALVFLPAIIAWTALGGPTPVPAGMRVHFGMALEVSRLIASNWLVPVTFAALAFSAFRRSGRVGMVAGLAIAATALALTDNLIGAALVGIVLAGGFAVDADVAARPIGVLLVVVGLAIAPGFG